MRSILKHGSSSPSSANGNGGGTGALGTSLHRLVELLRDTLPVVVELEQIRREADADAAASAHAAGKKGKGKQHDAGANFVSVDTFAKAAGWYRILYGDSRLVFSLSPFLPSLIE